MSHNFVNDECGAADYRCQLDRILLTERWFGDWSRFLDLTPEPAPLEVSWDGCTAAWNDMGETDCPGVALGGVR